MRLNFAVEFCGRTILIKYPIFCARFRPKKPMLQRVYVFKCVVLIYKKLSKIVKKNKKNDCVGKPKKVGLSLLDERYCDADDRFLPTLN